MATANKKQIKPLVSILPIEQKDIERFWPLAEFMVAEALVFSGKYADSSWVLEELKKNLMQCWIMFGSDESEESKVFGICVGQISELPNYSQYEIIICTGKRRDLWEDELIKNVTDFAQANKCKRLSIMARPGWEKVSKKWGWKKRHVQLEKWIG
jgi:esterase/lipase superfamily enzyme